MIESEGQIFELPDTMMSRDEYLRQQAEQYRNAALIGYGALLAANDGEQLRCVIDAMKSILWPQGGAQ